MNLKNSNVGSGIMNLKTAMCCLFDRYKIPTRMHSSRMHTAHLCVVSRGVGWSDQVPGGGEGARWSDQVSGGGGGRVE